ncbi:triose-phosphate isomerase [Sporosarcina sp. BI001-red]|uniref:triose-phosphate isomerase n=1 Tax=Sporosarcina sp. BI001-red TaxID=2282866 RepID=UPI000E2707E1|nr:triose-phosphate isomerase [Sporosarcina sp. BI001-red]REB04750.1 triose-phosphate isomerase [Sporosarcina sp. BI001-red]
MRKPIIAGNWKMYKTLDEAVAFIDALAGKLKETDKADIVICPPAPYLATLVEKSKGLPVRIGAQTMHEEVEGAFTGEISPTMLSSIGVEFVVLGHSERRQYYNETDESVNRKVKSAFEHKLTPIVCVGESLEQREGNATADIVSDQVKKAFSEISEKDAATAIVAYEPIWAIGTGRTATAEDANEVCAQIRAVLTDLYSDSVAQAIRIQYGGSVKPGNIKELLSMSDIDGALVGGASLDPESFTALAEAGVNV